MMRIALAYALFFALCSVSFAQVSLGNGQLHVSFSEEGQLTSLRWPGPGGAEQLAHNYDGSATSLTGAQWGLKLDGAVEWKVEAPPDSSIQAGPGHALFHAKYLNGHTLNLRAALIPNVPVLALHAEMPAENATGASFGWFQDFTPRTSGSPLAALSPWAADFAVCFDKSSGRLYHFRPKNPGKQDREKINLAMQNHDFTALEDFGEGVWIAVASPTIANYTCQEKGTPLSLESDSLPQHFAMGDVYSAFELAPDPAHPHATATLFIALASSKNEADTHLDGILTRTYTEAESDSKKTWGLRLAVCNGLVQGNPTTLPVLEGAAARLLHSRDARTGALLNAPNENDARVLPQNVAWYCEAFLRLGMQEEARHLLEFHMEAVSLKSTAKHIAGALPPALDAAGHSRYLPGVVEQEAGSALLLAIWRYAQTLENEVQDVFFQRYGEKVHALKKFLPAQFTTNNLPETPSFQAELLRDGASRETLLHSYLGLLAARELLSIRGEAADVNLNEGIDACEARLRFAILNNTAAWSLPPATTFWMELLLDTRHPIWKVRLLSGDSTQILENVRPIQEGNWEAFPKSGDTLHAAWTLCAITQKNADGLDTPE